MIGGEDAAGDMALALDGYTLVRRGVLQLVDRNIRHCIAIVTDRDDLTLNLATQANAPHPLCKLKLIVKTRQAGAKLPHGKGASSQSTFTETPGSI